MSTATPFPFDPQPGAGAKSAAAGGNASVRAGKPGAQGAADSEGDFARSLLEVQENEAATGETAPAPLAGEAGAKAIAATENGGAPHEVSQFLARLFAGEHPDQPALGKAFAPGQVNKGEGEPLADAAGDPLPEALDDVLSPTGPTDGEQQAPDITGEPVTDPAILAAALAEDANDGETAPPQSGDDGAQETAIETLAKQTEAAPPETAAALPDDEPAGDGNEPAAGVSPENEAAEPANGTSGEAALNSAPQSEAARARNASHLPPLPENANPRAQAMARPQFDGQAIADDAPVGEGGEKGKQAEAAGAATANATNRRNETAARPAPPVPQAAAQPQTALPAAGIEGQIADDAALAGTEGTRSLSQSAQASAATQLANQYSPTATVPLAQLAIQIAARHRAGHSRFEIRIDPPELGRVDVRLEMGQDGSVTTRMVVERAETLDLLQRDARALERALGEAGLDAQEGSLQFSLKGEGFGQEQAEGGEAGMTAGTETASELSGERRAGESQYQPAGQSDRALDIRV